MLKYVDTLAANGFDVDVVTVLNPQAWFSPQAEDQALAREIPGSINVHYIHALPWGPLGELLYGGGALPCPFSNWYWAANRYCADQLADLSGTAVVLAMYPCPSNLLLGLQLKRRTGARLVVDFRDDYRGVLARSRLPTVRRQAQRTEAAAVAAADLVVVTSELLRDAFANRYPQAVSKMTVALNGYCRDREPRSMATPTAEAPLRLAYCGAFTSAQKPEILLTALARLAARQPQIAARLTVDLYGPQGQYFRRHITPRLAANVKYHGFLEDADLAAKLRTETDLGFLSLADATYAYAMPGKLAEYVNLGLPLVASLPPGTAADLIARHDLGLVAAAGDVDALASCLQHYVTQPDLWTRKRQSVARAKSEFAYETQVESVAAAMLDRFSSGARK